MCAAAVASVSACTTFNAPLEVSDNGRHLVRADGTPFYYVADTPWQLLASLDLPDTKEYIDIRADQGFTVVQLVATPWSFDDRAARWDFEGEQGQARVNANGDVPFFNAQGGAPRNNGEVRFDRPNDAYWRHVDQVLDYLARKNMAAYFIPLWASNFSRSFSEDAHYAIGKTLGTRYRAQANLVWVLAATKRASASPSTAHCTGGCATPASPSWSPCIRVPAAAARTISATSWTSTRSRTAAASPTCSSASGRTTAGPR